MPAGTLPTLRSFCAFWVWAISGKSNYSQREPLIGGYGLADWEPLRRAHTMDPRHCSQASHQHAQSHSAAGVPADVSEGRLSL